ncbi:hypothetical protein D3Z50_19035 [Clostridiaceae bacterium]|nr:hypothetical protein [Clostridiaceae bacterium]
MNKTKKETEEAQGLSDTAQSYKVTCGTFKRREEALQAAAKTKKAGVCVSLVMENKGYSLLCASGMKRAEAETVKARIEAQKVKAEISEE